MSKAKALKISKDLSAQDFQGELIKFLNSKLQRKWIYIEIGQIYVRKSIRALNLSVSHHKTNNYKCLDIASINIDRLYQNQGYFKELLLALTEVNPYDYVYIECVYNEHLKDYLTRKGWIKSELDNCFHIENKLLQISLLENKLTLN